MSEADTFVTRGAPVAALVGGQRAEPLRDLPSGQLRGFGDLMRGVPGDSLGARLPQCLGMSIQ